MPQCKICGKDMSVWSTEFGEEWRCAPCYPFVDPVATIRAAQAPKAKGESGEATELHDALELMVDAVMGSGDATQALSIARALLARKPAEERGPEVGDLVMWSSEDRRHRCFGTYNPDVHAVPKLVLMRRAEVEARVKGG